MRVLLLVIGVLCLAPGLAAARPKPKVAVAPIDGDAGNKVGNAVAAAIAGKDFAVIGPKETEREMTKLGIEQLDAKGTRKLTKALGAVAVIDGTVSKGRKRSLHLEVHRRGQPDTGFTIEFKSTTATGFRRGIHAEIVQKVEGAGDDPASDDDDTAKAVADDSGDKKRKLSDDDTDRKRKLSDDDSGDKKRKLSDDDADKKRKLSDDDTDKKRALADDEPDKKRRLADDEPDKKRRADDGKKRRVAATDDEPETTVRRRKSSARDTEDQPRLLARVGAGASVAQRQLVYDTRSGFTQVPPRIGTAAGGGRVDGEIYPFALADSGSSLAGLGFAAAYDKTFGLSIKVPGQTVSAPINQSHYSIGARYRVNFGEASSVAFGLDFASRQYVADRSGLMGATLDAPDVAYKAISPGAGLRVPVTSSVTIFAGADALLIFEAGAIQTNQSYGPANVYGLEGTGGIDVALTRQIALRAAAEFSQIMISFKPQGSTLANNRDGDPTTQDIMGASDRSIGVAITLGLEY